MNVSKLLLVVLVALSALPGKSKAQITYYLDPAAIECPKLDKILYTMDTCLYIYNTYSNYTEHVRVIYDPSVNTANAGYKGRIAFGGSAGAKTGTHEMQHVLGVGTYSKWGPNRDKDNKLWKGAKAIAQLKEFDGVSAVLHADQSHFWPYGINTKWDNTHHHVYMVGALREDMGLSNMSGLGTGEYCNPPTIIPYTITNTKKILSAFAFASLGDVVILTPEADDAKNWSWTGPNGFSSDVQSVILESVEYSQAGKYVVTCTNHCGEASSREFNIIVGEGNSYYIIENHDTQWWLRPETNQVGSQMKGATPNAEDLYTHWEKIDTDNGWFYLKNRATGMYFRPLSSEQPERMEQVETSNTGNRVQWRFVGTEEGYGHLINREYYRKIRINSTDINKNYIEQTGAGSTAGWTQWKISVIEQNTTSNKNLKVSNNPLSISPNPAVGELNIKFNLPVHSNISLKIYNTLGQEVATLIDRQVYNKGEYLNTWSQGTMLECGSQSVFVVRLSVNNELYHSKAVLLK